MHDFILPYVYEVKNLGVYFTPSLNFNRHISYIVSKAFRMLGFINRATKPFSDATVLEEHCIFLMCAHVLSIVLKFGPQLLKFILISLSEFKENVLKNFVL